MTALIRPAEGSPTSSFIILLLWATLETVLAVTIGPRESIDAEWVDIVAAWAQGGVLAAILMAVAWIVFSISKPDSSTNQMGHRRRDAWMMIMITSLFATLHIWSLGETSLQLKTLIAWALLMLAGCLVTWFLMRQYFRLRIVHLSREIQEAECRSEVSILKLMWVTSVLAGLMGASRLIVGELNSKLAMVVVAGCLLGLQWWATAIWVLGRRRFFAVTIIVFVLVQLLVATGVWKQDVASNGDLVVAASLVTGVQLHLIMYLAILRASQYRFRMLVPHSSPSFPMNTC